jgi:hypothetical protein
MHSTVLRGIFGRFGVVLVGWCAWGEERTDDVASEASLPRVFGRHHCCYKIRMRAPIRPARKPPTPPLVVREVASRLTVTGAPSNSATLTSPNAPSLSVRRSWTCSPDQSKASCANGEGEGNGDNMDDQWLRPGQTSSAIRRACRTSLAKRRLLSMMCRHYQRTAARRGSLETTGAAKV